MAPRIVVVPPSHAETAEIAKKMAPAGFELVMSSASPRRARCRRWRSAEYIVCYPNVASNDAFYQGRAEAEALAVAQRRLRRRRHRGRAPRQGAGLQQRRRQRDLGVRARHHADAHGVAPGALAARQRVGRPLARQRRRRRACTSSTTRRSASSASAPSARRWRGSRARSACGCSTTTSRGCPSTRRTRSACSFRLLRELLRTVRHRVPACAAERFHPPHDRRGRTCADEARGDHRQHQPRPGDRRGGADQGARRQQAVRRRPRRVRPGAAAARQSALQAQERGADRRISPAPPGTTTSRASATRSTTCSASRAARRRCGSCRNWPNW